MIWYSVLCWYLILLIISICDDIDCIDTVHCYSYWCPLFLYCCICNSVLLQWWWQSILYHYAIHCPDPPWWYSLCIQFWYDLPDVYYDSDDVDTDYYLIIDSMITFYWWYVLLFICCTDISFYTLFIASVWYGILCYTHTHCLFHF